MVTICVLSMAHSLTWFVSMTITIAGPGGGLYLSSSADNTSDTTLVVESCTFLNNTSLVEDGGGVNIQLTTDVPANTYSGQFDCPIADYRRWNRYATATVSECLSAY